MSTVGFGGGTTGDEAKWVATVRGDCFNHRRVLIVDRIVSGFEVDIVVRIVERR